MRAGKAYSKPATASTVATGTADSLAAARLLEAARQLAMVTVEVDPADLPDLVATGGLEGCRLWRNESEVLVGIGESLRLPLRGGLVSDTDVGLVGKALASMVSEDPLQLPGTGPLAIGALPYDPCEPGWLSVPRLVLGHRPGRFWVTVTTHLDQRASGEAPGELAGDWRRVVRESLAGPPGTSDGALPGGDGAPRGSHQGPDRFELAATLPHAEWKRLVAAAAIAIEKAEFTKVVIGRRVEVRANQPFAMDQVLARLAALYPSCSIFHVEGFVGASPEMLVRKTGSQVWSHPLAGTVARSGYTATDRALEDAMLASAKDRLEHQVVVDAIATALAPW
ncbi:MAG TPA: chorismate-binding protein, partial [Acidimicrobiales bacterium]|nr:chorismate-binding protein [Acidimicrobiales bacterium]